MNTSLDNTTLSEIAGCNFDDLVSKLDAFLYIFISSLAVVGNIIVFLCYFKYRPLRGITNIYILSLSASDLLVALVSMPFSFGVFLCSLRPSNDEGKLGDLIYLICDMVPSILSIYALALVAVDRAVAITKPFMHRKYMNNKRATYTVIMMWIYVFSLAALLFVIERKSFTLFIIIMAYVVPVIIMIVSYILMGYVAKKHAKELSLLDRTRTRLRTESINRNSDISAYSNNNSPCLTPRNSKLNGDISVPLTYSENRLGDNMNKRRDSWFKSSVRRLSAARIRTRSSSLISGIKLLKRELKAAFTLSLILSCFILSWTPFIALNIEHYRCPTCAIGFRLVKYFKILHYTNSALNPILYILLNRQWRAAFRMIVCCRRKKRSSSSATDSSASTVLGW